MNITKLFTCTALLRKQLFCPGPFNKPFVVVNAIESLDGVIEIG